MLLACSGSAGPGGHDLVVPDVFDVSADDLWTSPDDPTGDVAVEDPKPPPLPFLFQDMALTLLDNLVEHSVDEHGDWTNTQTGDTVGLAPRILFRFGEALGRQDLTDLAVLTADWYLVFAVEALPRLLAGEDVDPKAIAGAPALVDAYSFTGETKYRDFIGALLPLVNQMILDDPSLVGPGGTFSIYGPLFTLGAIITLDAELALAIAKVEGELDTEAEGLLDQAGKLVILLDTYLEPGGYYAPKPGKSLDAMHNSNMLMALATMHVATGDPEFLQRAGDLIEAMEPLWDEETGAYRNRAGDDYIGLAENVVTLYGLQLCHAWAGHDVFIERNRRFFTWIEAELFRLLPEAEGGYEVILHDNIKYGGDWYWCSGCNFFAIYDILLMNELMGNGGPEHD